jgi:hypothetical protein
MNSHLVSRLDRFQSGCLRSAMPFFAALLAAPLMLAQNPALQTPAQHDALAPESQQITLAPSPQTPLEISAPVPSSEDASLIHPEISPLLSLEAEQAGSQSLSQSTPTNATATKTKPRHHGLGIALAVVGIVALASGVALYAGESKISVCNGSSMGCNEARDTGIALMPIGAGVAATGFYLTFHR